MKLKRSTVTLLTAGSLALLAAGMPAFAANTSAETPSTSASSTETNKLVSEFSALAGSTDNAKSLVTGLRSGSPVTLTLNGGSTTFTSPTKPLGYGEINIALSLAQESLAKQGITNPTPQQLQAALTGKSGILTLRGEGKGWGAIADSLGVKLGKVVSSTKSESSEKLAERAQTAEQSSKVDRPERIERPEKVERPGK